MVDSPLATKRPRRGKLFIRSACALGGALLCGSVGWTALHEIPGAAPVVADTARGLLGDAAVTQLEDAAYAISDRIKQTSHHGRAPEAHWEAPAAPSATTNADSGRADPQAEPPRARQRAARPAFRPADVGPVHPKQAAPGDGRWLAADPDPSTDGPVAYKTLIHPDPERSYSELFVVAFDRERIQLQAVAGSVEPESSAPGASDVPRNAVVPNQHRSNLLAAFNGGFKSRHGHFGMRVNGVNLADPRSKSCTIAGYQNGALRIGTYAKLPEPGRMLWFRQTPGCMVEDGRQHPSLANSKSWGATLDGETVIRRSAVGLDSSGRVLYVAISNSTSAERLASGMRHVGAHHVAQLDVNYSFPRVLFYQHGPEGTETLPLAKGFVHSEGQYLTHPSPRDFFYVTRKAPIAKTLEPEVPRG